jgi:hypothetical protein
VAEKTWPAVEAYFDTELNAVDPALDSAIEASVEAALPSISVTKHCTRRAKNDGLDWSASSTCGYCDTDSGS